jgi:hypothetical protein
MYMLHSETNPQAPIEFVKIVYAKTTVNGKVELIPLELYTDGSLKRSA